MEFIIELNFVSDDPFWFRERMPQWWQRFAELGGDHWQRWLHNTRFYPETPLPSVESLKWAGDNQYEVVFHTGSDGSFMAPMLVGLLPQFGCSEVEALLFSDEA